MKTPPLWPLALLLLSLPASAAEWVRVPTPAEGDQYYYDRSKLFIQGAEITYWKKAAFRSPQPVKGALRATSGLYRERIHCTEHTLKLISYLLHGTDGSILEYVASMDGEAAPIIPDSLGDVFEKTICALLPPPGSENASGKQAHPPLQPRASEGDARAGTPPPSPANPVPAEENHHDDAP